MIFFQTILEQNPQLKQQWQQIIDEIKSNQRLRIGFWLVLGILFFYIGMLISDNNALNQKQLLQAKQRQAKAVHLAKETVWPERAKQSQLALYKLQMKFNHASTQGAAKATLQGLINDIVQQASIEKMRVRVDDAENIEAELSLWSFVVSIDGSFNPNKLEDLLYLLSSHPHHLVIESLDVMPNITRFRMKLKYWFANSSEITKIENKLAAMGTKEKATNKSSAMLFLRAKLKH